MDDYLVITSFSFRPGSRRNFDCPGRSGKRIGIVMEAKMRAGRRRKLFRQEIGWRKPNYEGVSVI
jgi:hypothetical protein